MRLNVEQEESLNEVKIEIGQYFCAQLNETLTKVKLLETIAQNLQNNPCLTEFSNLSLNKIQNELIILSQEINNLAKQISKEDIERICNSDEDFKRIFDKAQKLKPTLIESIFSPIQSLIKRTIFAPKQVISTEQDQSNNRYEQGM